MKKEILTYKDLFEKLIKMEGKIDALNKYNNKIDRKFNTFISMIIAVELINLTLNYLIYTK